MKVLDSLWSFFAPSNPKADALAEIIAAMARGEVALTKRMDTQTELHDDLVQQFGIQQAAVTKQLADLRAVVAEMREQAKARPAVARTMADVRLFTGDGE